MLGATINYNEAVKFLRYKLHVEWVHKPFLDECTLVTYKEFAIKNGGTIELFGENYSVEDMENLSQETEGKISEFTFGPGGNEGYILFLKMESCQVLKVKTFDRNTFELFLGWVNALEGPNHKDVRRKIVDPVPVGSILYVIDRQSTGPMILPYRLESYETASPEAYPYCLSGVNPGSSGIYHLAEGWEKWPDIFYRIEDAISSLNN